MEVGAEEHIGVQQLVEVGVQCMEFRTFRGVTCQFEHPGIGLSQMLSLSLTETRRLTPSAVE